MLGAILVLKDAAAVVTLVNLASLEPGKRPGPVSDGCIRSAKDMQVWNQVTGRARVGVAVAGQAQERHMEVGTLPRTIGGIKRIDPSHGGKQSPQSWRTID